MATDSIQRIIHAFNFGPLWVSRTASSIQQMPAIEESISIDSTGIVGTDKVIETSLKPLTSKNANKNTSVDSDPFAGLFDEKDDSHLDDWGALQGDIVDDPSISSANPILSLTWDGLQDAVKGCKSCSLCEKRTQTVFGVGNQSTDVMVIGEGPGAEEDKKGEPFVGAAGRLLDKMLHAVQRSRNPSDQRAVYIANAVKCRPPGNRTPTTEEIAQCRPYLLRQIALIKPKQILLVGKVAVSSILEKDGALGSYRKQEFSIHVDGQEYPVFVTYHPAYLLRNPADKAKVWDDLCFFESKLKLRK